MATISLVVAKYQEDIGWVADIGVPYTVYDKGGKPNNWVPLPNVGREAQTYVHHCIQNYNTLADLVIFSQGDPFFHAGDFKHTVQCLAGMAFRNRLDYLPPSLSLTNEYNPLFLENKEWLVPIFKDFGPTFLGRPLDAATFWYGPGAILAVKRETILRRPLRDYVELERWINAVHRGPWIMELVWQYFWNVSKIHEFWPDSRVAFSEATMLKCNEFMATLSIRHPHYARYFKEFV